MKRFQTCSCEGNSNPQDLCWQLYCDGCKNSRSWDLGIVPAKSDKNTTPAIDARNASKYPKRED